MRITVLGMCASGRETFENDAEAEALTCSPFLGPGNSMLKVDRCL